MDPVQQQNKHAYIRRACRVRGCLEGYNSSSTYYSSTQLKVKSSAAESTNYHVRRDKIMAEFVGEKLETPPIWVHRYLTDMSAAAELTRRWSVHAG